MPRLGDRERSKDKRHIAIYKSMVKEREKTIVEEQVKIKNILTMVRVAEDILCRLEDHTHGIVGHEITEARGVLLDILSEEEE